MKKNIDKKIFEIAKILGEGLKDKYYTYTIEKISKLGKEVIFYNYIEPECGFKIDINENGKIEIENLDKIKEQSLETFLNINKILGGCICLKELKEH